MAELDLSEYEEERLRWERLESARRRLYRAIEARDLPDGELEDVCDEFNTAVAEWLLCGCLCPLEKRSAPEDQDAL